MTPTIFLGDRLTTREARENGAFPMNVWRKAGSTGALARWKQTVLKPNPCRQPIIFLENLALTIDFSRLILIT